MSAPLSFRPAPPAPKRWDDHHPRAPQKGKRKPLSPLEAQPPAKMKHLNAVAMARKPRSVLKQTRQLELVPIKKEPAPIDSIVPLSPLHSRHSLCFYDSSTHYRWAPPHVNPLYFLQHLNRERSSPKIFHPPPALQSFCKYPDGYKASKFLCSHIL